MKSIDLEEGQDLTSCETLIMKIIWDEGCDISAIDLRRKLKDRYGKDYSRTTLSTFLIKMSDKGYVRNYRVGRNAYVHAVKCEEEYKQEMLEDTKQFWFAGKTADLVCALFKKQQISKEEIAEIRRQLDELDD